MIVGGHERRAASDLYVDPLRRFGVGVSVSVGVFLFPRFGFLRANRDVDCFVTALTRLHGCVLTRCFLGDRLFFLSPQKDFTVGTAYAARGDDFEIDRFRRDNICASHDLQRKTIGSRAELSGKRDSRWRFDRSGFLRIGTATIGSKLFAFVDGGYACGVRFPFRLPAAFGRPSRYSRRVESRCLNHVFYLVQIH
jgi:hypothetical protein